MGAAPPATLDQDTEKPMPHLDAFLIVATIFTLVISGFLTGLGSMAIASGDTITIKLFGAGIIIAAALVLLPAQASDLLG